MENIIKQRVISKLNANSIFSRETQILRIEQIRKALLDLATIDLLTDKEMFAIWDEIIAYMERNDLTSLYVKKYCD